MPEMYMDVDAGLSEVPVNILPLIDDTDFKTRETGITYDQAGMDLVWNFTTTAGATTQTAVTPTTSGDYDWAHQGDGMYTIEIPASGGASINNDTEGHGWFTGYCTGVLPWRSPVVVFRAVATNNSMIDGATINVNTTAIAADTITAASIEAAAIDNATFAADVGSTAYATNIIALAVRKALDEINLDHLAAVADSDDVVDDTIIAKLAASGATADWSTFVNTTDSLQAVRDHIGDGTNLTEAGGTGDQLTAIDLPNQTMDITGSITGNLIGDVTGNVDGSVDSVTDQVDADVTAIGGTAQRATDLAEIAQYLIANSATLTDIVADDSMLAQVLSVAGDVSDYDDASHSLEAIATSIGAASGARYSPDAASTITTGTEDANTYAACAADDGVKWTIGDADGANTIDVICEMNMGEGRIAYELNVAGYYNRSGGGGYKVLLYAWNYTTSSWDALQAGTVNTEMRDRSSNKDYVWTLNVEHTDPNTTPGEVKINFRSTRPTTQGGDVLYLDYVSIVGQASASISPQAIALAVHEELDVHLTHISNFTGEIYYVSKSGDDSNNGHAPDIAFLTVAAGIAALAAGDRLIIKAGTYDEDGLALTLSGLELVCEIGTIFQNSAPDTVLTISGDNCIVNGLLLEPTAGEIGVVVSGSYCRITDAYPHVAGATGWSITGEHNVFERCRADNYTVTGFNVTEAENIFTQCISYGAGATRGFYFSNTDAHENIMNSCVTINNDTAGIEFVSGADLNRVNTHSSVGETTPYTDNGTDNSISINTDYQEVNTVQIESVDATDQIRDSILDDATRFSGANIDAAISTRGTADPGDLMGLANDAITSAKYDESTAFPVKSDDSGSTQIARVGADGDTLETLSDQIDGTATPAEVATALTDIDLDHLIAVADADDVADNSIIAKLAASDGDWSGFSAATDSLEAIRDRGDAAWVTGGGGSISDIINVQPLIPNDIDLANTATYRMGLMLINSVDDLPSTAEITPGTISIDRKAIGGTSWAPIVSDDAMSESAGLVYCDEIFNTGTNYAEGDSIRITMKSVKVTVAANDYEVIDSTGRIFYTSIRQTMRGTNSAATASALSTHDGKLDTVGTNVDSVLVDTGTTIPAQITSVHSTTDGLINTVDTNVDTLLTRIPMQIKKNTALNNFSFFMVSSSDNVSGVTGLTVTAQRSIDGAAFGSCSNSVVEIGNGVYRINLSAADLNGDTVMLRFTGSGALATLMEIITQS